MRPSRLTTICPIRGCPKRGSQGGEAISPHDPLQVRRFQGVKIETKNRFFYPDVLVTCETQDRDNSTYKQSPRLIIEVLSDSTEAFDRGDKFADYQSLPSLQEYVLINHKKARIECFRRTPEGLWLLQFSSLEDNQFELSSVEFVGKIADVYEEVEFIK